MNNRYQHAKGKRRIAKEGERGRERAREGKGGSERQSESKRERARAGREGRNFGLGRGDGELSNESHVCPRGHFLDSRQRDETIIPLAVRTRIYF